MMIDEDDDTTTKEEIERSMMNIVLYHDGIHVDPFIDLPAYNDAPF